MNKKGFTLVELIATIVVLGVILTIAVPSYNIYIEKTKESKCNADKRAILDASKAFVSDCIVKNKCATNYDLSSYVTATPRLQISDLIDKGFLNNDYSKYKLLKIKITGEVNSGITDYSYKLENDAQFTSICK